MKLSKTVVLIVLGILGIALLVFASRAPITTLHSNPALSVSSAPSEKASAGNATGVEMTNYSVSEVSQPLTEEVLGTADHGHGDRNPLDVICEVSNLNALDSLWISSNLLNVGSNVWVWFDPTRCGANPYPYRLDTLRWAIYWPGAGTFTWRMHVVCPATPGDTCSGPGGTSIWTSGDYAATYAAAGGHFYSLGVTGICVSGPFFLGMEYVSWNGAQTARPSVMWRRAVEPRCIQYHCNPTCTDWAVAWPANNGLILARVKGNTNDACTPTACQGAQPCVITAQPNDINEVAEPWPLPGRFSTNDPDGGCNNAPNPATFQDIQCGQTIFGRTFMYTDSATQQLYRDTDWYRLVLTIQQQVTWTVRAEIPVQTLIVQAVVPPCSTAVLQAAISTAACSTATVAQCLAAGTYYLWVGGNAAAPSTQQYHYRASLTCSTCPIARCCYGTDPTVPQCTDNDFLQCETLQGTWTAGMTCGANPCPVHLSCQTGNILVTQPPYNADESWTAVTSDQAPGYTGYDDFSNLATPVGGIRFWGLNLHYSAGWSTCAEDPMPFVIKVYNDSSGYPATASPTNTYSTRLTRVATTLMWANYPVWEYDYQFAPPFAQASGWISVQGQGDTTCWFLWAGSPFGNLHSLQWSGTSYTAYTYDLSMCLSSGECTAADSVTAYLNTNNTNIVVHFRAPFAGIYDVWSTTDKNAQYPTAFIHEAAVTAVSGDNAWTDPGALVVYKRYTVIHNCNPTQ